MAISKSRRLLLSFLALAFMSASLAHAQRFGQIEGAETNVSSYFYFVEPGEPTMEVRVLGTVQNPGLYLIGTETDTDRLLALAGGPILAVGRRDRRRKVAIRLLRPRAGALEVVHEAQLTDGLAGDAPSWPLQDGDVMSVEVIERHRFTLRDILPLANSLALIALSFERFFSAR